MAFKYLIGIDEVGRGPLAGPLAVGAVSVMLEEGKAPKNFAKIFRGIRDSKKHTPEERQEVAAVVKKEQEKGYLKFSITFVGPETIDERGLTFCINKAIKSCLKKLALPPEECLVLLDGGIYAPKEYLNQKTIIKGDEKEKVISLASIVAKVARDSRMKFLSKKYEGYGFELHKGYGTRFHDEALRRLGPCPIHRRRFLKKRI